MAVQELVHNRLKKAMADIITGGPTLDLRAMIGLRDTWTPNADDDFVQTAIAAGFVELTVTGYAREAVTGESSSLDDTNDRATMDGADVVFDAPDTGEDFDTLIIFNFVTDDTDSWLAITYDLDGTFATDGTPITFQLNTAGLVQIT